jgi:hypothetical protein
MWIAFWRARKDQSLADNHTCVGQTGNHLEASNGIDFAVTMLH